jgi:predicted metalloprotease
MRLDGRRESSNVEDRRGLSGGAKVGIGGIGGIIIAALFAWMSGGDPLQAGLQAAQQQMQAPTETVGEENFTEEEQELASDCKKILASTEEVWTKIFQDQGWGEYQFPTLVLFTNQVNSACGSATAAVGPFYCSGDQKLYVDLSFFTQMKRQLGVEGNTFAYAYVIAHEIGHHIEYLTGTLNKAHSAMNQTDKVIANQISVRLELLADYYAGVWAHYEDAMNHSMEYGDLEKGLELAKAIGDDWLQKKAQGRATPESFTHGTSDQRKRWLKRGFETGDMRTTTFSVQNYNDL